MGDPDDPASGCTTLALIIWAHGEHHGVAGGKGLLTLEKILCSLALLWSHLMGSHPEHKYLHLCSH